MKIANKVQKFLWGSLSIVMLTACDDFNLKNEPVAKSSIVLKEFFHPVVEGSVISASINTVYIPVYSEILVSGGGKLNLAITLSVRNTDFTQPLIVNKVSYYNSAGKLIEDYLEVPYRLDPMASAHFFVAQTDVRGGLGANFIVQWSADKLANEPVIEAVMAGSTGTQGTSFMSHGRTIKAEVKLK